MMTATIRIRRGTEAALREMGERFSKACRTGQSTEHTFEFESPAALFRLLSPKRWELIECLQELGPSSMRGLARELERDVKRVHEDVHKLIDCGLIDRTEAGKFQVPYEVIHTEFDLHAVA